MAAIINGQRTGPASAISFGRSASKQSDSGQSALPCLEAALHLVDHINPALAANQAVGAVTATQRFQRVTDLHVKNPGCLSKAVGPYLAKMGFAPPTGLAGPGPRGLDRKST